MTRVRALLGAVLLAGCSLVSTQQPVENVRELAGAWQGRLALQLANASATMTIKESGAYEGALHLDGGIDRPFSGAIVVTRPGRLRYQGTHGNGIVTLVKRGDALTLRFVPDGGGGGGSFTRARLP
jgi:hypothetical protein